MATKLTTAQIKENAKVQVLNQFAGVLESSGAVQFAPYKWAVRAEVEGQEVWVEVAMTSKQYTKTKVADAFDPFEAAEDWKAEDAAKAKEKETKDKEKAAKVAKDKEKAAKKAAEKSDKQSA